MALRLAVVRTLAVLVLAAGWVVVCVLLFVNASLLVSPMVPVAAIIVASGHGLGDSSDDQITQGVSMTIFRASFCALLVLGASRLGGCSHALSVASFDEEKRASAVRRYR